jgi:calcineurin-like phosphoesterase family protein
MNKELRIRQSETQKVYLTSDWHIFHNPKWPIPIWKMRGFSSLDESNRFIIESVNSKVRTDDILINLGDLTLNCSESQFEELLSQIHCQTIYCLFGNHNGPCYSIYKREVNRWLNLIPDGYKYISGNGIEPEIYPLRYRNIVFVGNYLELTVDGQYFILSHFPQSSWNHSSKGSIHCHGHVHSTKEIPYINKIGRMIDVGFDYNKKPISVNEIKTLMSKIDIKHEGHH